jgi:hypothetical protein
MAAARHRARSGPASIRLAVVMPQRRLRPAVVMPRRRLAIGLLGGWALLSLARLSRLVEPAPAPPGQDIAATFDFYRAHIPSDAGYLFVLPGAFGQDTGTGPRLRYELYPRRYDDIRAAQDAQSVRQLMQQEQLRYIVVPDASAYLPDHWLRQPQDWLERTDFAPNQYLLAVTGS